MPPRIEQLKQIAKSPVWDGNLISKTCRDELVKAGYVERVGGYNIMTVSGIIVCQNLGIKIGI